MLKRAQELLALAVSPQAQFRDGQWEAVESVAVIRRRVLVVQRTGWGKSLVYFLASKLLREQGAGPTLLVSPLLSLMRDQIAAGRRAGVQIAAWNCSNRAEHSQVLAALRRKEVDLLLVSPERLGAEDFEATIAPAMGSPGMLAVDEAHCVSEWGHDFRPDYRRIGRLVRGLPKGTPMLATTATATDEVVEDIGRQLGGGVDVIRGQLGRDSLRLQAMAMPVAARRLAWLAQVVPTLPGSGIIYCITQNAANMVASWLQDQGVDARAYHAGLEAEERPELEELLRTNRLKALVATVALGMGFDKPDLRWVIHYQAPSSPLAYYQQVGRAGRAVEEATCILMSGVEDAEIHQHFRDTAFPRPETVEQLVSELARAGPDGALQKDLDACVNAQSREIEYGLRQLEIARAAMAERQPRMPAVWRLVPGNQWDGAAYASMVGRQMARREEEWRQVSALVRGDACLMQYITRLIGDRNAPPCGRCAVCTGNPLLPTEPEFAIVQRAIEWLGHTQPVIKPRKKWAGSSTIRSDQQMQPGIALCSYGDGGYGDIVKENKYQTGRFDDRLVDAAKAVLVKWDPNPRPTWLTYIPSRRHPELVPDFANRLANALFGKPAVPVLERTANAPQQKQMANSRHQMDNARNSMRLAGAPKPGPVLLIDDIVDSRWTMTVAAAMLREAGSGPVIPFALAHAGLGAS